MYFDNAATSHPKPETVYATMDRFLRTTGANPGRSGHRMAVAAEAVVERARQSVARLLDAPRAERLIWTSNGTEALNLALFGYLGPGDRVVTTSLEHNAVARALRALEQRGVAVVRVPCPGGRFDLQSFLEALRTGPKLAVMVHASNVTGEVLPVAEVAKECHILGLSLVLDAAQTAGSLPLDLGELDLNGVMVAFPGHKSLLGPPGTGALYLPDGIELRPLRAGGTGSRSESDELPAETPSRYESGTLNTVGLAGLGAATEWLQATGIETIRRHESRLVEQLWHGLANVRGVTRYGPPPGPERASIVSFTLDGWEPVDLAAVLDESFDVQCRAGLHCAPWAHRSLGTYPAGTVRLSPGYYNTEAEVDAAVGAVREIAGG